MGSILPFFLGSRGLLKAPLVLTRGALTGEP